jgi:nucleotide-binding universal stress UspA family protein
MKPSRRKKLRTVLAAVDPDPTDETRNRLNIEILERASSIASSDSADVHVIHAWNAFGGDVNRNRRWMKKSEIRLYVEQIANEHRKRLNNLMEQHLKQPAKIHMIQGRPGEVIPEIVDRESIDLLVMGTVCRTGIPGFFIGNTAEMILSQVDCSVLTVKPEGFVTPVKLSE